MLRAAPQVSGTLYFVILYVAPQALDIDPQAWPSDFGSAFPSQVRFCVKWQRSPLTFKEIEGVLLKQQNGEFKLALTGEQVCDSLCAMRLQHLNSFCVVKNAEASVRSFPYTCYHN